jgi:peptide subunit release factor 1 (eRF1)
VGNRRNDETTKQRFVTAGVQNVTESILGGCVQLKNQLEADGLLGDQLRPLVIGTVDVSYDGEPGLREAVKKSRYLLRGVASVREQQALESLFEAAHLDFKKQRLLGNIGQSQSFLCVVR